MRSLWPTLQKNVNSLLARLPPEVGLKAKGLLDSDPYKVCNSLDALHCFSGEKEHVKEFSELFAFFAVYHPEPDVRGTATVNLERFAGKSAEPFFRLVAKDTNWQVRLQLVQSLERLQLFSLLNNISRNDPEKNIREAAFRALEFKNEKRR